MKSKIKVEHNNSNGEIRYPRLQAQADYHIQQEEYTRKDGIVVVKKTTSLNDEKLADTCTQLFQESEIAKSINYEAIREEAIEFLEPKFKKHDLFIKKDTNEKRKNEILKKQEIAISQYMRNYIKNNYDLTFEVNYDEFIKLTGIKTAKRVGVALEILDKAQGKSSYEYKVPEINEDFSEITYELAKISSIPKIGLILDEEMGEKYKTISEYAKSPITNKRKHIKGIRFELSKSYLSSVLGVDRDYTLSSRKNRNDFTSSYSYRFDMLIRSIEKVQHIKKFNYFELDKFQRKIGTNFNEYKYIKQRVLIPCMKDMNESSPFVVELIEYKLVKEVIAIAFKITRKTQILDTKFGVNKIAYYIASRLFYFSKQKIDNLLGFAKHIEKTFNSLDLVMYDNKYLSEWKEESLKAFKAESEIIKIIENSQLFFKEKGLEYDENRLCIVEKRVTTTEDGEHKINSKILSINSKRVENPIDSLFYIKNLIEKEGLMEQSIVDYIPFKIAANSGWIEIKDATIFNNNYELIVNSVKEKKLDYFRFENDVLGDLFRTNIMRENFKELHDLYRSSILKLSKNEN